MMIVRLLFFVLLSITYKIIIVDNIPIIVKINVNTFDQSKDSFLDLYCLTFFRVRCRFCHDTVKNVLLCFVNIRNITVINIKINSLIFCSFNVRRRIHLVKRVRIVLYILTSNVDFDCNLVVCVVPLVLNLFGNCNVRGHLNITLTHNILNHSSHRVIVWMIVRF